MSTSYFFLAPLLAAVGNSALAAIVLRRDPRNELNRIFAFATTMVVFWNLNIFIYSAVSHVATAFYWSRVFRVGTLMMPVTAMHFFFVFSERRPVWVRRFLVLAYTVACALILLNAGDLLVSHLHHYESGFYFVGTRLYPLYTSLAFVCAVVTFYLLISEFVRSTSPRKRLQAKLWLFATSVAIPFALTNLLRVPSAYIPPLGNLANTVYVSVLAYGILRYRLMDVDLAVTEGLAYAAVSLIVIGPAFALVLWLEERSFGRIQVDFSVVLLLLFVVMVALFPPLRLKAQSRILRSLFQEKHEYRAALNAFSHSIVRIIEREKLIQQMATTLHQALRLEGAAVLLLDEAKHEYTVAASVGQPLMVSELAEDHDLVLSLRRRHQAVLRDELEASSDPRERVNAVAACRMLACEVCVPLTIGGKLIGFVSLGRKHNLRAFSMQDLVLLEAVAAEVSVALENARLYEELKRSQDIIRRADRLSALGTLAAGIAHEVRNPLVSIQTFFQLAPERLHDEEFFTTFLSMTANEVKRISNLITELLSFARAPTRSLGAISVNDVAERVVTLLEPEARKHKLTLTRALSADVPLVYADADQIKQVLINLVLNAIQATPAGGWISVVSRGIQYQGATFGRLEIRDTGRGIAEERLGDIFNPFFTTKDRGTGLGLTIAHRIVTEHGGFLRVESTEGRGSSFSVDLPGFSSESAYPAPVPEDAHVRTAS